MEADESMKYSLDFAPPTAKRGDDESSLFELKTD